MKQSRPLVQVAFAVMLMLVLTLFPHHHHDGGAACWTEELCPVDGRTNDGHTEHGEAGQDDHDACCVQSVPLAKVHVRSTHWDEAGGDAPFTIPEFISSLTPLVCGLRCAWASAPPRMACVCPFGKHIQRRGPPVCQL